MFLKSTASVERLLHQTFLFINEPHLGTSQHTPEQRSLVIFQLKSTRKGSCWWWSCLCWANECSAQCRDPEHVWWPMAGDYRLVCIRKKLLQDPLVLISSWHHVTMFWGWAGWTEMLKMPLGFVLFSRGHWCISLFLPNPCSPLISHVDLELTIQLTMALNSWSSCICLPSVRIAGMYCQTWFICFWGSDYREGLEHGRQALYKPMPSLLWNCIACPLLAPTHWDKSRTLTSQP